MSEKICCLLKHIFEICTYVHIWVRIKFNNLNCYEIKKKKVGWSSVFMSRKETWEHWEEIFIDISSLINHFSFLLLSFFSLLFISIPILWILSKWTFFCIFWFIILVTKQTGFVFEMLRGNKKKKWRMWERYLWNTKIKKKKCLKKSWIIITTETCRRANCLFVVSIVDQLFTCTEFREKNLTYSLVIQGACVFLHF